MITWPEFMASDPELAAEIDTLLRQYGPGLAYLATVRRDGGPRVHPVSPVLTGDGLFCLLMPSPKRSDLDRDGRYALHSYPAPDTAAEAYLSGRAEPVTDPTTRARVAAAANASPDTPWKMYELTIEVAMVATEGRRKIVWRDPATLPGVVRLRQRRPNGPCTAAADSVQ